MNGAFLVRVIGQWDVSEAHCVFSESVVLYQGVRVSERFSRVYSLPLSCVHVRWFPDRYVYFLLS